MFELIVRVVLASGTMAAAGALGTPDFELAWRLSLFFAAYSYLLYVMEQRDARNPGVSGLAAVADCGVLSVFMADMGYLQDYGFVVALPMVIAFLFKKANAAMMAPLVAAWLMIGTNLTGGGNAFATGVLVQALGILLCGLVLGYGRSAIEERRERKRLHALTMEAWQGAVAEVELQTEKLVPQVEAVKAYTAVDESAEIKESFRALSDTARDIEKKGRRDRACVQMIEKAMSAKDKPFSAIAASIQEFSGAEGATLYSVSQYGDALVARAAVGAVEHSLEEAAIDMSLRDLDAAIAEKADSLVSALKDPESRRRFENILLKSNDKVVGMVTLYHSGGIELEASTRRAKETIDFAAEVVADQTLREQNSRRLRESELLYTIATMASGAMTADDIIGRISHELWNTVSLDHLSFWMFEDGKAVLKSREGAEVEIIEDVSFAKGKGVTGWIDSGAPFASFIDARNDIRIATHAATKKRIGSLVIVPLEFGAQPMGFVVATTSRTAGVDLAKSETIRVVCAETSHAIARTLNSHTGPEGLASPSEFYARVRETGQGFFIYFEVPKKEALSEIYGKPAVEHAVRRFAVRLRAELPSGAIACRRPEGDYVAYIPGTDIDYVRRWTNDITVLASMIGVHTPDGRTRIPLALRSKTAPVNQQMSGISTGSAA